MSSSLAFLKSNFFSYLITRFTEILSGEEDALIFTSPGKGLMSPHNNAEQDVKGESDESEDEEATSYHGD